MFWIWWIRLWPYITLAVAVAIVFGRSLTGEFLSLDDAAHITQNPWLISGEISHFWKTQYNHMFTPITYTMWAIIYKISTGPLVFHLFNLVLHILNSWLMFWLARKLLSSRKKDSVELAEWGRQVFALIAALTFALHPFQVETVAWISGGRDLLAGFFGLSAAIVAWNTADRLFPSWAAILRRIVATSLFIFGLLCKPGLAVLPPAVKWLSWFTERRGLKWAMMWFWLGLGAAVGGMTLQVQSDLIRDRLPALNNWDRPIVAADAILFYLKKFILCDAFNADYGRTPAAVLAGNNLWFAWYWWLIIILVTLLLVMLRLLPSAIWGGLGFFVIMLLPVLGIWEYSAQVYSNVYDRFMYLPIVGLGVAFAGIVSESKANLQLRILLAFLVCGWWGYNSAGRVGVWHDDKTLFEDVLDKNPASYLALVNLAVTDIKINDLDTALQKLEAARSANPRMAVAWARLAEVYSLQKNPLMVKEVGQLLTDTKFLDYNRSDTASLALIGQMLARVQVDEKSIGAARDSYCYARRMKPSDESLQNEIDTFFSTNPELAKCAE